MLREKKVKEDLRTSLPFSLSGCVLKRCLQAFRSPPMKMRAVPPESVDVACQDVVDRMPGPLNLEEKG